MSTRATYQFLSQHRPTAAIYIHHDGYPVGAAYYFYRAFMASGSLSAEAMIRGNDRAELTESHDAHGDTEWRYTLDGEQLKVEERYTLIEFGSYPVGWRVAYCGDWVGFVNKHLDQKWLEGAEFKPLKRVRIGYVEKVYTPAMLRKLMSEKLELLGCWILGPYAESQESANMQHLKAEIAAIRAAITAYGDPDWQEAA